MKLGTRKLWTYAVFVARLPCFFSRLSSWCRFCGPFYIHFRIGTESAAKSPGPAGTTM